MTTQQLKDFIVGLGFLYSDFDIFEHPGCVVIIINKWVWWWKRKKMANTVFSIRPMGIMIRWYFCRKYYSDTAAI